MKLSVVGVGPGNPDLITVKAIKVIEKADLVITPHSKSGRASVAEMAFRPHLPEVKTLQMVFSMKGDDAERDRLLKEQLEENRTQWENAESVALPVIGDSSLYATGAYLYDVWKELVPDLELELVPGIPAYSLAASLIPSFLVLHDEVLTLIPASKDIEKIKKTLAVSNTVALYKPYILRDKLKETVKSCGPWSKIYRIDRAGLPEQRILTGDEALDQAEEYLSILLLWR